MNLAIDEWRQQTRPRWIKHQRAAHLMMRPWIKERVKHKWMNEYYRQLMRMQPPPEVTEHSDAK